MSKPYPDIAKLLVFLIVFPAICIAQTPTNPASLASQVVDPTAPLKSVTLQDAYSLSTWGIDARQNQADFRVKVPHDAFGMQNILRVSIPYVTSHPTGYRGLGDVVLYNIFVYSKKWGSIAAGGDVFLGRNKGPGINTSALGPTLGVVVRKNKWTYGVLNQNFFSFGDIAATQLQPILAYTFSDKVSVSYGEVQYTIDWKQNRFVNVPLSVEFNLISSIPHQTVHYYISPQYNAVNETGARKWTITAGIEFLLK